MPIPSSSPAPPAPPPRVLLLGIGNLLWADEGFGVRAVETFHRHYDYPPNVRCMDGGTQGLHLLPAIQDVDVLIVFDAIDFGRPPATLCLVEKEDVPLYAAANHLSLHQTGFQEVLAAAVLLDRAPPAMALIGVQPVQLDDYGGGLRPAVKAQLDPAVRRAADYLTRQGIPVARRRRPRQESAGPGCAVVTSSRYERERPSEQEACRFGDPRVLGPRFPGNA